MGRADYDDNADGDVVTANDEGSVADHDDEQAGDNELIALEIIHRYVELLDKYFGSVSVTTSTPSSSSLSTSTSSSSFVSISPAHLPAGVRAGHHLQLREGLLHAGRAAHRGRGGRGGRVGGSLDSLA